MDGFSGAPRACLALGLIALLLIGSTCGSSPAGPGDVGGDGPVLDQGGDGSGSQIAKDAGGDAGGDAGTGGDSGGAVPKGQPGPVAPTDDPKLLIGTYTLKENGVVDGDTFKVDGIKKSLRLLFIDTEETPKPGRMRPELLALMKNDFATYARRMRGDKRLPVKYATPMGVAATDWARKLLGEKARLRLERDEVGTGLDRYGRTLCHAWVMREDGAPLLYSLECVRQGYSPYFDKYGRSERFHDAFVAAQKEAMAAKRGIWDPAKSHYPDYAERIAWWSRRGEALARFKRLGDKAPLMLGNNHAIGVLSGKLGQEVWVIGILDDHDKDAITRKPGGALLRLGGRKYIEIEVQGDDVVKALAPEKHFGLLIAVRGKVDRGGSKMRGRNLRFLRILVTDAAQVTPGDRLPVE